MYDTQESVALLPDIDSNEKNESDGSDISNDELPPAPRSTVSGELHRISRISTKLSKLPRTIARLPTRTAALHTLTLVGKFLVAWVLIPLRPRFLQKNGLQPRKKAHATTYLDSLRGWAAVIVFNSHWGGMKIPFFFHSFTYAWLQGKGMVDIFFVISGYVLTYRMVKLMRLRENDKLFDTVVSSIFRRYIRLYGMVAISSFIALIFVRWGLFVPALRTSSLAEQILDCVGTVFTFGNPFVDIDGFWHSEVWTNKYFEVFWTIPVEFRGSIIIWVYCIGVCKLSNRNRMALTCASIIVCFCWYTVYPAMFLGGMLLADLSFVRLPESLHPPLPQPNTRTTPRTQPLYAKVCFSAMLVCSIFLLSQPRGALKKAEWPWPYLDDWVPGKWPGGGREHYFLGIGSLMLVTALDCYPTLQAPLNWNFSRYLGDLSFGIYVTHWVVKDAIWVMLGPAGQRLVVGGRLGSLPFTIILYVLVLWTADLFSKLDNKVVLFARSLEKRLFV